MDIAIVGAGLMGKWHSHSLKKLGINVMGIVDTDEFAARRLAGHHHNAEWFSTLDALLSKNSPDVVHICTPLQSHMTLALAALDHGAHVVCEKPLADSADEVHQLLEHANKKGKRICPVHQFATQHGVQHARYSLEELGKVSWISFVICTAGAEGLNPKGKDTVMADILPHPFSVISTLWPDSNIRELNWNYIRPANGEVLAHCLLDDMPLSVAISISARPTCCYLVIQGSRGRILVDFFHGFCIRLPGKVSRFRKIIYPFSDSIRMFSAAALNLARRALRREPAYPGLVELLQRFYEAIEQGTEGPVPESISLAVAQARDHFLQGMYQDKENQTGDRAD